MKTVRSQLWTDKNDTTMNKQETINHLTDLMGVIQKDFYKRGIFMPLEFDSNSRVCGDLRVHGCSQGGISIDLYNFEGDGLPVCDGLKPCTLTFDDGSTDIGHLFCMHYNQDDVTPLVFLFSHDEYGDYGDIDVEPESVPSDVLENIVKWLEGQFHDTADDETKEMERVDALIENLNESLEEQDMAIHVEQNGRGSYFLYYMADGEPNVCEESISFGRLYERIQKLYETIKQ